MLTSAPSSIRVSMRTAVWMVICKQPAILDPFKGFDCPYCFLRLMSPGISFSASSISLRPHSAREMSAVKNTQNNNITYIHVRAKAVY